MITEETITISKKEYEQLKEDSKILGYLYAGGVDNWEWYSDCFPDEDESEDEDMKDNYDFSNGERGKFHQSEK